MWLAGLIPVGALFGKPCGKPCGKPTPRPGLPDGVDSDALAGESAAVGDAASFGTLRRLNLAPNLVPNLEACAAEGESPDGAHASPSAWPLSRLPLPVAAATSAKDLSVPGAGSTLGGFADGAHFPLRYSVLKSMQCAAAETQQRIVIARPPTTQPPRAASLMVGEHGGGGRGGGGGAAGEGARPGNRGGHKGGDGGDGTGGGGGRKLGGGGQGFGGGRNGKELMNDGGGLDGSGGRAGGGGEGGGSGGRGGGMGGGEGGGVGGGKGGGGEGGGEGGGDGAGDNGDGGGRDGGGGGLGGGAGGEEGGGKLRQQPAQPKVGLPGQTAANAPQCIKPYRSWHEEMPHVKAQVGELGAWAPATSGEVSVRNIILFGVVNGLTKRNRRKHVCMPDPALFVCPVLYAAGRALYTVLNYND